MTCIALLWIRLLGISLLGLAACTQEKIEFKSEGEFLTEQREQGYVLLGSFEDPKWPAKITSEKKQEDEISFRAPNGNQHRYPGYDGYTLRVVQLTGQGGTVAVRVLRSKEKR